MLSGEDYSDTFLTWCAKTNHLSDEEWAKGMAKLERKVTADAANGNESWPPSYAEFVGYCRPTTSPDGKNSVAYIAFDDPEHPSYEKPKGIEDLTLKDRRIAKGRKTLDSLKDLF